MSTPREEIVHDTPHGGIYLRRLRRAQLSLSLLALVWFAGLVGSLPLVLYAAPGLLRHDVLGIPLGVALLLAPPFQFFVAVAWLYQRRADALDEEFREVVSRP